MEVQSSRCRLIIHKCWYCSLFSYSCQGSTQLTRDYSIFPFNLLFVRLKAIARTIPTTSVRWILQGNKMISIICLPHICHLQRFQDVSHAYYLTLSHAYSIEKADYVLFMQIGILLGNTHECGWYQSFGFVPST